MRKTIKSLFGVAGAVDLAVTYGPPTLVAAMTGGLGHVQDLPFMYIWLGGLAAFALAVWIKHWVNTPTGKDGEKRAALYMEPLAKL